MQQTQHAQKRSLSPLYCLHQAAYFVCMAGISAFAVTYLMERGFGSAQIGVMLAMTNVLSCVLQPAIGAYVDKTSVSRLQKIIPGFLLAALASIASIELLALPQAMTGMLYVAGYLSISITIALFNPLCAHYSQSGYQIDYGAGTGIGSLSFSFASLGYGFLIARLGTRAMMLCVFLFVVLQLLLMRCYPRVQPTDAAASRPDESLSIFAFALRYRRFMVTMLGVMCLTACHAMSENFLIQIFTRIGGGSENVGIALFLACVTAAPFMLFFERIQARIGVSVLMRLSGLFYILKAVLLVFAHSVTAVYLIELLQTFTYAFLQPSLYYLVIQRIAKPDMAKGQTLATALFTLGMAMGNSLGGIAIEHLGLSPMLAIAACIAVAGTLLINITLAGAASHSKAQA